MTRLGVPVRTMFASHTKVPVEQTRAEIDRLLTRNGATQTLIGYDSEKDLAAVAFTIDGARFRLQVPMRVMAAQNKRKVGKPLAGFAREQFYRSRWRAVLLLLKAKLEIVAIGVSTVEREFMADLLLPNGQTVEHVIPVLLERGFLDNLPPQLTEGDP
jgi:hypothetical protein